MCRSLNLKDYSAYLPCRTYMVLHCQNWSTTCTYFCLPILRECGHVLTERNMPRVLGTPVMIIYWYYDMVQSSSCYCYSPCSCSSPSISLIYLSSPVPDLVPLLTVCSLLEFIKLPPPLPRLLSKVVLLFQPLLCLPSTILHGHCRSTSLNQIYSIFVSRM